MNTICQLGIGTNTAKAILQQANKAIYLELFSRNRHCLDMKIPQTNYSVQDIMYSILNNLNRKKKKKSKLKTCQEASCKQFYKSPSKLDNFSKIGSCAALFNCFNQQLFDCIKYITEMVVFGVLYYSLCCERESKGTVISYDFGLFEFSSIYFF